ncbi:hypothetical protein WSM22_03220 [Cytophagales bacterium WSM2-2]|nr:hypothetical protein WSM22_03220 [Cytophagales bacterium WSM2-2]
MEISQEFRDQILIAMPELADKDARKIAQKQRCTSATVYNHWKRLKHIQKGNSIIATKIMIAIGELAVSKQKDRQREQEKEHRRLNEIQKQLSGRTRKNLISA